MSLKFSPGNHTYKMDGKKVQGVTTILNLAMPKPAIAPWAAKTIAEWIADNESGLEQLRLMGRAPMVNAIKNIPWEKRDEAAIKGIDVHAIAEKLIHGESVDVPAHLVDHVKGYADLIDAFGIEPILTEVSVGTRKEWYAGRLDIVAKMKGEIWLLDNKTSKGVYGETALQTSAYGKCEFYVNDGDWETEIAMPHIDRIGVIHITDSGSTLHDLGDIDEAFKIFRHAKFLANKIEHIKGLVSEPLVAEEM